MAYRRKNKGYRFWLSFLIESRRFLTASGKSPRGGTSFGVLSMVARFGVGMGAE